MVRLLIVGSILAGAVWVWREALLSVMPHPTQVAAQPTPMTARPAAAVVEIPVTAPAAVVINEAPVTGAASEEGPATGVWTSRDGRTMKGAYVSSSESAVTVRRTDGQVFVIPFVKLADGDVAWVRQQARVMPVAVAAVVTPATAPVETKGPVVTQRDLDEIVARFPYVPKVGGEVTNDLQQLHEKYRSMVKFMRPTTMEANLKMIRSRLEADVKTLSQIAGTGLGDGTGKRQSGQSAAAENGILSARRSVAWLEGALSEHLRAYDALMASGK